MNKLLTYTGVMPVFLGDINFMQDAAADAFKKLARALMNSESDSLNAILQGVEITTDGQDVSWSAGIVVINGEILPVAAGSASAQGPSELYLHINSVLSGGRTFKDGTTHQCYDTRSAIINTTSTDGVALDTLSRLHEDVVVDDQVYIGSRVLAITTGNLIRKSGLWFMDINFTIPEDYSPLAGIGAISFDLSARHYEMITNAEFIVEIYLYNTTDGWQKQPLKCTITKSSDPGSTSVTIRFEYVNGEQVANGSGSIQMLLPLFY